LWKDVPADTELTETSLTVSGNETIDQLQKQNNCCSGQRGLDPWYNCTLQRLASMDGDYRNEIMG